MHLCPISLGWTETRPPKVEGKEVAWASRAPSAPKGWGPNEQHVLVKCCLLWTTAWNADHVIVHIQPFTESAGCHQFPLLLFWLLSKTPIFKDSDWWERSQICSFSQMPTLGCQGSTNVQKRRLSPASTLGDFDYISPSQGPVEVCTLL